MCEKLTGQFAVRSLSSEIYHKNLRMVLIAHRRVSSADEMESLLRRLLRIIYNRRQEHWCRAALGDLRGALRRPSEFFLSANLFHVHSSTCELISGVIDPQPETDSGWPFALPGLFADLLQMAATLTFSRKHLSEPGNRVWFEGFQCLSLVLLTRLHSTRVSLALAVLFKLHPQIFKGKKDYVKGLFAVKSFRQHNDMYDFCLEHDALLEQSTGHWLHGLRPERVCNWLGNQVIELDQSSRVSLSKGASRAEQEGLDRNLREQIELLRRLPEEDKLRVKVT